MELVAHPALAADARLRTVTDGFELRLVVVATFVLVAGPTDIVEAEEVDEAAARWLMAAAPPAEVEVAVLTTGLGQVANAGAVVPRR